MMMATRKGRNM